MGTVVEYTQLASGGVARATEAGRSSAKKHCDAFCLSKGLGVNANGISSCERLKETDICNEKFFREFATYLTTYATKSTGLLLMSGTATQYLSAIKDMAMKKYSENRIWEERQLDKWYPSLRVAVEKTVNRRQIQNGLPTTESSLPIGRSLLFSICETLMKDGRVETMKRRLAVVMTFLAVGRAGEVACSTWTSASWDRDYGNLIMEWNEIKTGATVEHLTHQCAYLNFVTTDFLAQICVGESDPMNFFSDADHMELDFYHCLSCYLILGGGNAKLSQSGDCNWIIPDMARNIDTASAMLTKYVRESLASCSDSSIVASATSYEGTSLR